MTCAQCADSGEYDWFDSLNDRKTSVICLCPAGTALLRKTALSRVATHGHVSSGTPLATIATTRQVEEELVREGLIELDDTATNNRWRLTEKGRAR